MGLSKKEIIRGILLEFTETMDDGSNCIEIDKYDNLVNKLNKVFSLTDVSSSCNVTYKKGFRGLCKCCKGDGWINND